MTTMDKRIVVDKIIKWSCIFVWLCAAVWVLDIVYDIGHPKPIVGGQTGQPSLITDVNQKP
jgi:hypothetical protein